MKRLTFAAFSPLTTVSEAVDTEVAAVDVVAMPFVAAISDVIIAAVAFFKDNVDFSVVVVVSNFADIALFISSVAVAVVVTSATTSVVASVEDVTGAGVDEETTDGRCSELDDAKSVNTLSITLNSKMGSSFKVCSSSIILFA